MSQLLYGVMRRSVTKVRRQQAMPQSLPAAGMTLKFFGLFFFEQCGLSPVVVSLLATVSPFCVSSGSFCAQAASKWCVLPFLSPVCSGVFTGVGSLHRSCW